MKKIMAFVLGAAVCASMFAGCAERNDNVDSNPSSSVSESSVNSRGSDDSSKNVMDRAESMAEDIVDGGKRVVDDTVSTADDVVDNITK
ncbi:hypothetical protein [Ruminococcus sp. FC2018]|uniref:hypothetical protein n=1 Tax=Ruminococcus sp. FC2018 TaxID=1410617 RepID=UPI0004921FC5|nr:hypothetical protein [Ruminococcus sp. FC2018]